MVQYYGRVGRTSLALIPGSLAVIGNDKGKEGDPDFTLCLNAIVC